jgi:hypothetical protein
LANRLSGEKFVQGDGQVPARRLGPGVADPKLIVHTAPVPNSSIRIEHENLRGSLSAKLIGNNIADIFQNGKIDMVSLGEMTDLRNPILLIGVNSQEGDAFRIKLTSQIP